MTHKPRTAIPSLSELPRKRVNFRDGQGLRHLLSNPKADERIERLTNRLIELHQQKETIEAKLKELALIYHSEHGKSPNKIVIVRVYKDMPKYDRPAAFRWAWDNLPGTTTMKHQLNVASFNDAVRRGLVKWDGVTQITETKVSISETRIARKV